MVLLVWAADHVGSDLRAGESGARDGSRGSHPAAAEPGPDHMVAGRVLRVDNERPLQDQT